MQQEFPILFNDEGTDRAMCTALEPPEKLDAPAPWVTALPGGGQEYHIPPEIFVSEGSPGSIVDVWVNKNGPGIHHIALQVESVADTMAEWQRKGWAEFSTNAPLHCEGLTQVFTKPSAAHRRDLRVHRARHLRILQGKRQGADGEYQGDLKGHRVARRACRAWLRGTGE